MIVNPEQHKQVSRKTAQSELDEQPPAEFGLEGLFNLSPDLLAIAGKNGYFKRVNPAFEKILGYTTEELLATPFISLVHPDDQAATLAELEKLELGITAIHFENRYRCKDQSYRWLAWTTALSQWKECLYVIARDVTQQKQTEAVLWETQARYELLTEGSKGGIWDWNLQTNHVYYSSRWKYTLGFENDQISNDPDEWFKRVHPDDIDQTKAALNAHLDGLTPIFELEQRVLHKDGTYHWMLSRGATLRDTNGKPCRIAGSNVDITEHKQVQEALYKSKERYRSLVEATTQIIWDTNVRGKFVTEQPRWSAFTGQTFDELKGWGWLNAVHPEDQFNTAKVWAAAVCDHTLCELEHRLRRYDGEYRDMSVRAVPVMEVDGSIREWVGIHTDITERKQAEASLRKNAQMLQFLLEHTPAAIAMFDKDIKFHLASRRYLEDYNLCNQDIIGKSAYEVFPELPNRWKEIHQRCLQGAVEQCEEDLFVRANGEQQWVKWELRPWTDSLGEISGLILCTEVITERRKAKEKLEQLNERLLHSNRDLEQFAYVASHDLQEPLRAVNSYAQLLARKYQGHLDVKADKYLGYIMEGATRMQQLINDLLEFSRVGTHGKTLQEIDTEVILSQVLADLKIAIAESQAIVTHDPLPTVIGDEIQLIQLFQNLIGNAIKFCREQPPRVHISVQQKKKEWVFEVRDNGIGMENEFFERIFTIFQRLHSRTEYPGTGIGLAVCKKIVERHGGQIWVESTLGVGTTFYFSIPQKRQETHEV
ncbi:MAG: PAS domain S-box protein [Microcoleus sp. SIO2G3]|nr:PAS domain S-box protein [Microcoleus sp. SIO2G3]